jgi:glycosyltransferase involved in cell wall biosynthesis
MGGFIVRCLVWEQRISALFATHVLCADHIQKEYLESYCKIPGKKITVMMNLPDEKIFQPLAKRRSEREFRLIYHGTIAKRLGIDLMLEAVSKIGDAIPVRLFIYGTGDFLGEALSIAEKLNLNGKVSFNKSFFAVEMVPEMVRDMDVGIIANRRSLATNRFMMPVKLLEYVYLRIPVIAPRLEIIENYFNEEMVKYYEPENAEDLAKSIMELYRDPEEREKLVRNALKFYEKHSWKSQEDEYMKLLY